jgi:hypothetical protein
MFAVTRQRADQTGRREFLHVIRHVAKVVLLPVGLMPVIVEIMKSKTLRREKSRGGQLG